MPYAPYILTPNASDIISQTQPTILNNFTAIENFSGIDHIDLQNATTADIGKHKAARFVNTAAPTVAATEFSLYANTNSFYLVNGPAGATTPISGAAAASGSWTWLPSGLLLQWGTGTAKNADPGDDVAFPIAFPNNCYMVVACMQKDSPTAGSYCWSIQTGVFTKAKFQATAQTIPDATILHIGINYFAIGN